ncbi:hypothetical protein B0T19DRAFT_47165 [Cercophora scortea]|uniref:Uncharacterized protein n=1 Tax=Cercophora scortea TaxID=314031 RepID=A0AAE0MLL7_9PEZI|nr:hypothetical protein B0T19DRAFT_47165 [Cercophora scortea]
MVLSSAGRFGFRGNTSPASDLIVPALNPPRRLLALMTDGLRLGLRRVVDRKVWRLSLHRPSSLLCWAVERLCLSARLRLGSIPFFPHCLLSWETPNCEYHHITLGAAQTQGRGSLVVLYDLLEGSYRTKDRAVGTKGHAIAKMPRTDNAATIPLLSRCSVSHSLLSISLSVSLSLLSSGLSPHRPVFLCRYLNCTASVRGNNTTHILHYTARLLLIDREGPWNGKGRLQYALPLFGVATVLRSVPTTWIPALR